MEQSCREPIIKSSISSLQMGLLRRYSQFQEEEESTLPSYLQCLPTRAHQEKLSNMPSITGLELNPLFGAFHPYTPIAVPLECKNRMMHPLVIGSGNYCPRRARGEKKAIPDHQKDERYFERRKRNNQAAKKSRDARKIREDQIALRAAILEHENAMMRAQILTLRDETQALRSMLLLNQNQKPSRARTSPTEASPCANKSPERRE